MKTLHNFAFLPLSEVLLSKARDEKCIKRKSYPLQIWMPSNPSPYGRSWREEVRLLLRCKQRAAESLVAQLMPSPLPLSSQLCSRHFSAGNQTLCSRVPRGSGVTGLRQHKLPTDAVIPAKLTGFSGLFFWGRILRFGGGVLFFFLYFCCYCLFHLPANAHACMFRQGLAIPTHCSGLLEWLLPSAWMTSSTTCEPGPLGSSFLQGLISLLLHLFHLLRTLQQFSGNTVQP